MKAGFWFVIAICTLLPFSAAHPAVTGAIKRAYETGPPAAVQTLPSDYRPDSPDTSAGAAANIDGDPATADAMTTVSCTDNMNCPASRQDALNPVVRLAGAATGLRKLPAETGMTILDVALMLFFAVGLLAYQLDRKQRVLRQSSLFAEPSR